MISRRSIRIKVLQALYGQFLTGDIDLKNANEVYQKSIKEVLEVNLCYIQYSLEVFKFVEEYSKQQLGKFLISESEKTINTSIIQTQFYQYFAVNESYKKYIKKHKIDQFIQSEYVRDLFFKLIELREYKDYLATPNNQFEYNLLNSFFKKILFNHEDLQEYLDSTYANIEEDADLVHFQLKRSIKFLIEDDKKTEFVLGFEENKNLEVFANDLIKFAVQKHEEFTNLIKPKLRGWEAERIPVLDMTIIKMALTELLYFPSIPTKVTVNEYIDLSKLFCNEKSKDFINGILDRLMKELQSQGKIKKEGRGLD